MQRTALSMGAECMSSADVKKGACPKDRACLQGLLYAGFAAAGVESTLKRESDSGGPPLRMRPVRDEFS